MKHSESLSKFATAFVAAQSEFKNPAKNKKVDVATRSGSSYSYKYADLAPILEDVRPILNKNGISIMQGGSKIIETLLLHNSGEWLLFESDMDVFESSGKMNNVQEFGATVTYGRRYSLTEALGIAADEDNDASKVESKPANATKTVVKGELYCEYHKCDMKLNKLGKPYHMDAARTVFCNGQGFPSEQQAWRDTTKANAVKQAVKTEPDQLTDEEMDALPF